MRILYHPGIGDIRRLCRQIYKNEELKQLADQSKKQALEDDHHFAFIHWLQALLVDHSPEFLQSLIIEMEE